MNDSNSSVDRTVETDQRPEHFQPALLPFLPMVFVAWADGRLTDAEIESICAQIHRLESVDRPCREVLGGWLDPSDPPTSTDLNILLEKMRAAVGDLSLDERLSLTELGHAMARLEGVEVPEEIDRAVERLEASLGFDDHTALIRLLARRRSVQEPGKTEPRFEVAALTGFLDGDYAEVRRRVRDLISRPEFSYRYDIDRSEYRRLVLDRVRILANEGLGRLSYPKQYQGGGDMGAFVAAFETAAHGDLSVVVKFGVQFGLFGGSVLQLGTSSHHEAYLARIGALDLPGCFAMTETDHGSNVYDLETVAVFDAATGDFVIDTPHPGARKDYIGNAAVDGRMATVFAQLEVGGKRHGVHALLVPIRTPEGNPCAGVGIEDCGEKLGLNGVDNGRLWFEAVRVPRSNLLDRFGRVTVEGRYQSPIDSPAKRFFTMLGTLVGGRVSVALGALSAAKSAITIAVRYGSRRRQFGPEGAGEVVLLDYRSHQRRLMPRLAAVYALHFGLRHLARRYVDSTAEDRREVEALAAGLKAYATRYTTETIQECREACGGQGYLAVNRLAALKADTDVFTTFEGDNTVLLQLVAKSLLSGFRRQFGEMGLLGLARFVARQGATAIAELNPVTTRKTDDQHLLGHEFQLAAMQWRQDHLLTSLAKRIKKRLDEGSDSFEALNQVQDHALAVAEAHVELVILNQFVEVVAGCEDGSLREILDLVCSLFALSRIDAGRGWFQAHNYIEAPKAKAIRKLVNRLCAEVREQAVPLVDAFAIPDAVLGAPIGIQVSPSVPDNR